jgi:ABC-2 type transport system ATP-binding protein
MSKAISMKNVRKTLGKQEILKGISFDVEVGDIFGYLGPNGAGKTTTIRILLGLFKADSGTLEIFGKNIESVETRKKIGFVLEKDGLYDNMTAEENIDYYSRLYGFHENTERIIELLELVGLEKRAKDKINTYSKGMRQRLALARALVHEPEILILDEPTSGVDPSGQIEIRKLLIELANKRNKTIFLSSHNLDEVQRICNRIALIDRGEIKLYGELDYLRKGMSKRNVIVKTNEMIPDSVISKLKEFSSLGLQEIKENILIFTPEEGTKTSDIIGIITNNGVEIEEILKKEASLEEMYSAILKETEPS